MNEFTEIVAHRQVGGIQEGDARALSLERVQVGVEGNQNRGDELDETVIGDQARKLGSPELADVILIERLEVTVVAVVEGDKNRHDFTLAERADTMPLAGCSHLCGFLVIDKCAAEIVHADEEFE